jgi:hypothetical protein
MGSGRAGRVVCVHGQNDLGGGDIPWERKVLVVMDTQRERQSYIEKGREAESNKHRE